MRCALNSFMLTGKTLTLYIVWVFGGFAGNNFIPTRCFLSSHFIFWTWNCIAVVKFWFETALVPSPVEVVAPLASTRTVWEAEGVATCPASQRRRTSVVRNWLRVEARVKGLDWLQASQVLCHVVVTAVVEATCEFSSAFGKDGCFYWWNSTKHSCVSCTLFLIFVFHLLRIQHIISIISFLFIIWIMLNTSSTYNMSFMYSLHSLYNNTRVTCSSALSGHPSSSFWVPCFFSFQKHPSRWLSISQSDLTVGVHRPQRQIPSVPAPEVKGQWLLEGFAGPFAHVIEPNLRHQKQLLPR